ncbi:MAG: LysR family transcriptional regulator [Pseudomonadota bacterium]
MSDVNLKLLQSFVLVAEYESFRKAARMANRTPSAISMQIRDLEEQVGLRLFNRTPQHVSLTAEGRDLYAETARGMKQITGGLERLFERVEKRKGKITMACAPTLASWKLGGTLASFRSRFPESVIQLLEAAPRAAIELLEQQRVEFYLGPELPGQSGIAFEKLFDDQISACVPPEFDEGAESLSLEALARHPVLMLDEKTALRTLLDNLLADRNITLNMRCELQSAHSSLSLAAKGLGIAILPSIALAMGPVDGFRTVPIDHPQATRSIGLVAARGYVQHNYTEQLLKLIRSEFSHSPPIFMTPGVNALHTSR